MTDVIQQLADKAHRSIKAARRLCEEGDYDFAVSRAYYALFYVSEALLAMKGIGYSKHSAVISGIYEQYVRTGDLPNRFHQVLNRSFKLRQKGDYMGSLEFTREIAEEVIADVEEQMNIAKKVIGVE